MTEQEIQHLLDRQRAYYRSGATLPVAFRKAQLKKLYAAIQNHQEDIHRALKQDLGKSSYEAFMCESGLVLTEISYMLRHVKGFAKKKTVASATVFSFSLREAGRSIAKRNGASAQRSCAWAPWERSPATLLGKRERPPSRPL